MRRGTSLSTQPIRAVQLAGGGATGGDDVIPVIPLLLTMISLEELLERLVKVVL
jgi:hypothetical protein